MQIPFPGKQWRRIVKMTLSLSWSFLCVPSHGLTQEGDLEGDTVTAQDTASGGNTFVPLPVIFYQPETKLGFGGTAIYFFQLGEAVAEDGRSSQFSSSLSAVGVYTTRKQIISFVGAELYPSGGRYRILGRIGYSKFPTKYWGIGNDTPDSAEEDYTPRTFGLEADVQREVSRGWYVGLLGQFAYRTVSEVEEGGLIDSGAAPGSDDGLIIGAGLSFTRDTRKSRVYPRSSSFHTFRVALYDGFFGSDYDYATFTLDLRRYTTLFTRHVLALRGLGVITTGDPPFDYMPQLGGDEILRGYFAGRFRDRDLLVFQLEYRAPVWWRIGVVGFAAAGQVAHDPVGFRLDEFHPSAGFGLRFLLSEREEFNIRADFAWGFDVSSTGFYLNLGETF